MAKVKKTFRCSNCGATSAKWVGKCPSCGEWNTFNEEVISQEKNPRILPQLANELKNEPIKIADVTTKETVRISSELTEFDRILGGGIIPGSLILLGGEPGIGKSTIALQMAMKMDKKILYNSGEESTQQIKLRAERISNNNENCYLVNEQSIENLLNFAMQLQPHLIVIDSIQTIFSSQNDSLPGSVNQLRECTHLLMNHAKKTNIPVIIIGHMTKEGALAGPKLLEHMVDVVMLFDGDANYNYRIIRTLKNRFGAVPELAIYEMTSSGLNEVLNPSSLFFQFDDNDKSGVSAVSTMNGIRPIFSEAQVLVSNPVYSAPQRNTTGFDIKRLNMLLAVIEKKLEIKILMRDVYLNISGGLKIQDPASDLAVIMATLSSYTDKVLDKHTCFISEVSLTGDLKPVNKIGQRIAEADKIGFKKVIVPRIPNFKIDQGTKLKILQFETVEQVVKSIFQMN